MNDLTQTQIYQIVNTLANQATGKVNIMPTNTSEFVAVAQTALLSGYDNLLGAISQVLSRTIFSIRPYSRKFAGLQVDNIRFGNHVRKLQAIDGEFEEDARLPLTDGKSVDMYTVNKPKVLQTNFYGQTVFEKSITIFKDQLDVAFSSPDELGRFVTMVMTNVSDLIEQAHEQIARLTIANLIGGVMTIGNTYQVVHLLTEYNALTGLSLTNTTVYLPNNFKPFMQWVFSRVAGVSEMLTERSVIYHQNITGKEVARHTPKRMQKIFLYAPTKFQTEASVLADTYHDNYLGYASNDVVNYWQSIKSPNQISVSPVYLDTDGSLKTPANSLTVGNIYGVIMDEETAGYTVINQWSAPTPFNAKGGYSNMFWHFTDRYWNDFTENCVILLLD